MKRSIHFAFLASMVISLVFITSVPVHSQFNEIYSTSVELEKDDTKGRYFGTYVRDDGSSVVFYASEKGGFHAYQFGSDGSFTGMATGEDADRVYATLQDAEYTMGEYQDIPVYDGDMIAGSSTWTGKLKINKGPLYLRTDGKFIYGPGFDEEESYKPEVEGTWNTVRIGYRAYTPYEKVRLQKSGKQAFFEFKQSGPVVFAPEEGSIQAAGIITEKVSIRNPPETNANRIVVFSIPGDDPENMKENIVIFPYASQAIGVGNTANNDFAVMVMPLNAPSTYKPHKKLVAPEGMRNRLFIGRFDQENNLRDTLSIPSASMVVDFQYMNDGKNDFIIGMGNDKDKNWRWHFAAMELNRIQFVKLGDDGEVIYHKVYNEDEIASKLYIPGSKNNKHKMKFAEEPRFEYFETLPNGNHFMYGEHGVESHAMLVSSSGELIRYIIIPLSDPEKNFIWGTEMEIRGNDIYLAVTEQPYEFWNGVQEERTVTKYYSRLTRTQIFEIFHITRLMKIDAGTGDVIQKWLGDQGKDWYTCGNTPVMFLDNAIYATGREKGPKGKEIFVSKYTY